MAESPPRRKRNCGPKVKTGCQTCKIRRVKCDEAKPACERCTSTGRKCDGYVAKDAQKSNSGARAGLVLLQKPLTSIPGSAEERRGFSYYLNRTVPEFSGYYNSSFWGKLLLQAAMKEPSLRHAVIGIGSLHEAFTNSLLDYSPEIIERGFAINQYTKALGLLRKSLSSHTQEPLTALMSCILFVCFDSIRGHFGSALVHLQSGIKILRDLMSKSSASERAIAKELAPVFIRLNIQAVLYIERAQFADRATFALEMIKFSEDKGDTPEIFTSVDEARNSLNQTANGLFGIFYSLDLSKPSSEQSDFFPQYAKYTWQLAEWSKAFESFMHSSSKLTSKEVRGAAMLKIQHMTMNIMTSITMPKPEDPRPISEMINKPHQIDQYHDDFVTIIRLSGSLIAASEADAKGGMSPLNFSADLGLIGPLYYCSVKPRDYSLRRAALQLLRRCQRREGMWDSSSLVPLVQGFWQIESRYESLQNNISDEAGEQVDLGSLVELHFDDGMKWQWKMTETAATKRPGVLQDTWAKALSDRIVASVQEDDKELIDRS